MDRWVNQNQEAHWDARTFYRDARSRTAEAYAQPKIDWICDQLAVDEDDSVLDVGAGTGLFTYWWSQRVAEVVGLELSDNMAARSAVPELMRVGDAYDIPYAENSFDVVFAGNLLHHLERPVDALTEMRRVARRGVAICEPNRNHPPMAAFGAVSSVCRGILHYSRSTLPRIAEQAELKVRAIRLQGYIYENRSPAVSLPLAQQLERRLRGGAYMLLAADT
jgi:ubiquinone/menaquinone biosynthesis C-methylase UbiE